MEYAIADYVDFEFHVKQVGAGNRSLINAVQLIEQKYARKEKMVEAGRLSKEAGEQLADGKLKELAAVFAEHVIVGWKGVTLGGKELEYSKDNCAKFLADKENELLFSDLIEFSTDASNFQEELEAQEEKNSEKS